LVVKVRDYGIGMNKKIKERLFSIAREPGHRGTAGETSTGLGLVICKDFLEMLHGSFHWKASRIEELF